ncbi:mediator of RNA polymerase II transcription subunit 26 isoform X2 [Sphaerodactylus townsendi]|uniref:mediator of RNA polymerase II transcription subunit 26 isoform X2 n=1 Tax=Sphaerodactylus townsendi TaxID=933632 RepID=UPI00202744B5|nr:mediator of RNA polymerase II transcription subunit 26 isoform X2 [Sphaerodactylus townsendi]
MTAAPGPSPQQIRDRLLQAIDPRSNIHNMVVVLEVISSLEKYPITKEVLEETRLGKLINDVRKKTKNEELAKRAKKLLRNWQKLIEPVTQNETVSRGLSNPPGSANGGAHNCRMEIPPVAVVGSKPIHDVKNRNDVQKLNSPKSEKPGNRKRRGEPHDDPQGAPPSKVSKAIYEVLQNSSPPPTNGIGGSPESFPSPPEVTTLPGPEGSRAELGENDKLSKIPVNAVRPHTSSPGLFKSSGTSLLLKTAVMQQQQQQERVEEAASQLRSPCRSSFCPRHVRLETLARQHATCSPKGSVPPSSLRPPLLDAAVAVPLSPPLSLTHPPTPPTLAKRLEAAQPVGPEPPLHSQEQQTAPESQHWLATGLSPGDGSSLHLAESLADLSPDTSKMDSDSTASGSDSRKKKKYRPKDYVVNLDGQALEAGVKPVRLKKERRLTFDPKTGEIKPLAQRDSLQADLTLAQPHRTDSDRQEQAPPLLQSPFEQTNWKELSRNEIIQSYLDRQSTLLSSSGVQTPGAPYFMSQYLKQEESTRREARKTHVLVPVSSKPTNLPGVTREVTREDLNRISDHHWPGVNGCYDTQGNWYDWTQCISLDPHGDDGHLNILPYVCLD